MWPKKTIFDWRFQEQRQPRSFLVWFMHRKSRIGRLSWILNRWNWGRTKESAKNISVSAVQRRIGASEAAPIDIEEDYEWIRFLPSKIYREIYSKIAFKAPKTLEFQTLKAFWDAFIERDSRSAPFSSSRKFLHHRHSLGSQKNPI